jgi:iron-sulfur cluster assembly protein
MIRITDAAAKQLRELLTSKGESPSHKGLRLQIQKGGCAGLQYGMRIDAPASQDAVERRGEVMVIIDPLSQPYLSGCELDYEYSLSDAGFRIHNPNAERSCGCGTSFEPKPQIGTRSAAPLPQGEACPSEAQAATA